MPRHECDPIRNGWRDGLLFITWYAVIPDQRISEDENLAFVAGVGQRFIITDHPGVKNNLS